MNKVFLIGNLTKDPDVRTTGGGTSVCTFSIAVDRRFKAQNGEKVTDYFNIVAWRQLADLCGRYLAKRRKASVVGELQNRSYDAKDGTKRYVTEIVADEIEFLTPRDRDGAGYGGAPSPSEPYRGGESQAVAPEGFTDVDDDDLPF